MASIIGASETWFRRLLWLIVFYMAIVSLIAVVDLLLHPFAPSPFPAIGTEGTLFRWLIPLLGGLPTAVIGVMVLRRSPGNMLALLLLIWAGGLFGFGLSIDVSPWLYNLTSLPISIAWVALLFVPLYFPDGRAYPRWWNLPLMIYYAAQLPLGYLSLARLERLPLRGDPLNPWYTALAAPIYDVVFSVIGIITLLLVLFVVASPYLRYRRASAHMRQQIKWLALGGVFVIAPYLLFYVIAINVYRDVPLSEAPEWIAIVGRIWQIVVGLYPAFTIGNAILRHKLYDIDIIIRRTLIYTVLTTILGVVYFGGIVLTQQVFRALTGQSSELAIVVSTLLIAALFAPLRRRVQDVIDRRLYRKKYDAEKVLADFQKNLRDEVDMETLKANLIGVLEDTMQPTKIALWVKEPKS